MMEKQVRYRDFIEVLGLDFNFSIKKEYTLKLPADKKAIKSFVRSKADTVRIFDGKIEHPYMLDCSKRNDEALSTGKELRFNGVKTFREILKELPITLKSEPCKICEGGGWYTNGTKYTYKEIYIEI